MGKHKKTNTTAKAYKQPLERGDILAKVVFPNGMEAWPNEAPITRAATSQAQEPSMPYAAETTLDKVHPKILNDDKNFHRLVQATRQGLPYKSLLTAQGLMPFSLQEWAQMLHVSTRSIDRLKKDQKTLTSSQSEKLIEVTLLYDYGVDVFGSSETFSQWLHRTNIGLGGVEPKSLLDTNQGMRAVETALSRIEYGVLA